MMIKIGFWRETLLERYRMMKIVFGKKKLLERGGRS